MSILDQITSKLSAALGGNAEQHPGLAGHVLEMINNPATGGFTGLVQAFHDRGLGGVVASWIGTGPNQPVTADQIAQVLGPERIQVIATKLGVPPETVTTQLATVLPHLIDHLTPNGSMPSSGALQQGLEALRGKAAQP